MQRYQPATREQVEHLLEDTKAGRERSNKPKKKWTLGKVISTIVSTLVVLVLLGVLGTLVKTKVEGGYPQLLGYRIFRVETGSMIPTLPIGSIIIVHQPQDPSSLPSGTVITYQHEDVVVTHRIINVELKMDEEKGYSRIYYTTKGDNPENSVDPWTVDPESILGEMIWHFSF